MDTVFLPEWDNIAPKLKRKRKIIFRFVDDLTDNYLGIKMGACGMPESSTHGFCIKPNDEQWFRISYKDEIGHVSDEKEITFRLIHELAETDFWTKTRPTDKEAQMVGRSEVATLKNGGQGYQNLLDEQIANMRALKAIRRMWPSVKPIDEYEENK
jgi:hypothetical protein